MSLKARKFIYGMGVGFLILGAWFVGKGLSQPSLINAEIGGVISIAACNLGITPIFENFSGNTYSTTFNAQRLSGTEGLTFHTSEKTYFCTNPNQGKPCIDNPDGVDNQTRNIPSGGTGNIQFTLSRSLPGGICVGTFQTDVRLLSVEGKADCHPGGVDAWGFWNQKTPIPGCGELTPTPTPTTPVSTPTPTTPVSTPTPTTPVVTSTPTPTVPVGTGTPTPTTPVGTGTPTPTPTSPAGPTPTPTPDTRCLDTAPSAVRNLKVSRLSPSSVKLTWDKPETGAVTDNAIRYRLVGRDFEYAVTSAGNATEYMVGSLLENTDYCFSVYPKNNCAPGLATEICTGGGQVLGSTTLPPTSSLPLPSGVILATFYTLLSAGMIVRGWAWVKQM